MMKSRKAFPEGRIVNKMSASGAEKHVLRLVDIHRHPPGEILLLRLDLVSVCRPSTVLLPQNPVEHGSVNALFLPIMRPTSGTSLMLKITTPWCSGVSSVMRPRCALTTWLPYRKGISPLGLIHTYTQCQRTKSVLVLSK
jgi:hypothetical protein